MASTASHTIALKGRPCRREATAGEAITPGHLIRYNSSLQFIKHNVAGGYHGRIFAAENELLGKDIDTAYASNDRCLAWMCESGCEIYALVAAAAPAITAGDILESAGDGTLRKALGLGGTLTGTNNDALNDITFNATWSSSQANEVNANFKEIQADLNNAYPGAIAMALESVDNSGGGTAVRIRCLVL
jgi:hypothetical protein